LRQPHRAELITINPAADPAAPSAQNPGRAPAALTPFGHLIRLGFHTATERTG
jgi:hypothetical protein